MTMFAKKVILAILAIAMLTVSIIIDNYKQKNKK
jgi:hypothetical protein